MFGAFKRSLPLISIFHNPTSPPSQAAMKLLNASLMSPYPPTTPSAPPLEFNLEVVENQPPTVDQIRTILSYLPTGSLTSASPETFISAHPTTSYAGKVTTPESVVKLATSNPQALKWPIVVDWTGGRAAIGSVDGVKGILEELRKKRDGEVEKEEAELEYRPGGWFS